MAVTNYSAMIFDDTGRAKPSHYVYAAFGERDGKIVCKIGFSSRLQERLYAVSAMGSTQITFAKAMTANGIRNARSMEAMLHAALAPFRDHHEWFVFDPTPEHKERFKAAWLTVGRSHGAAEIAIDIDEMREAGVRKALASRLHVRRRKW